MGSMVRRVMRKSTTLSSLIGEMGFIRGGKINWFPGHMAAATRAIRDRLKLSNLVIELRDARIPLSSANQDLQTMLTGKRRVIALNKKDLANTNIMHLLDLVEYKLKEVISREPTLLVMVVGVPNVGKSALINSIHRIASARFPSEFLFLMVHTPGKSSHHYLEASNDGHICVLVQEKRKKQATVGPLPGVTQDIAGFKIAHRPSIFVLDTPGVLVPGISDIATGLKLAATGSVNDSVVGEERIAQYLLAVLNIRGTPLHWRHSSVTESEGVHPHIEDKPCYDIKDLLPKRNPPCSKSAEDIVTQVQEALCSTLNKFDGSMEDETDLGNLIDQQFEALQKALKIPHQSSEARTMISKKFLTLFRTGRLGPFILDVVPDYDDSVL